MTERQALLARQPPLRARLVPVALTLGSLRPAPPPPPRVLVPKARRTTRGSCRLGAPGRGPGDPGEGGGVQGDSDKGAAALREAHYSGRRGLPREQPPVSMLPSSVRDTVPRSEERASRGSRRLEVTRLEGSQELPGPRADATCLEGVSEANLTVLCPVHTQIMKTGLETAGLGPRP